MDKVLKVKTIAEEFAKKLNLEIIDVEWVKEYDQYVMRIIADKDGGIDIDDLTNLNEMISNKLDELDFIDQEYNLEVSSPGIERPLKNDNDILKNLKEYIHVDLIDDLIINKTNYGKEIEGYLEDYKDNIVYLKANFKGRIKLLEINKEKTKLIRLAIKF